MTSTWPRFRTGANRQIGETQLALLRRAHQADSGQIVAPSSARENGAWCAAKRLHQRGLMQRKRFGNTTIGFITIYEITPAGRRKLREYESR